MSTWSTLAAATPGAAHMAAGHGSSDAHRIVHAEDAGVVGLVVADGLGSLPLAPLAAHAAASAAARALAAADLDAALSAQRAAVFGAVAGARAALHAFAAVLAVPIGELGTTLLVALISDRGAVLGGVGDGFLVLRSAPPVEADQADHHLLCLVDPDPVANGTPVLGGTGPIAVEIVNDPYLTGALLATDGLEPSMVDAPAAMTRAVRPGVAGALLRHADEITDATHLQRELSDPAWDVSSSDDRTAVLAVRTA
jgi:hypothetical protein